MKIIFVFLVGLTQVSALLLAQTMDEIMNPFERRSLEAVPNEVKLSIFAIMQFDIIRQQFLGIKERVQELEEGERENGRSLTASISLFYERVSKVSSLIVKRSSTEPLVEEARECTQVLSGLRVFLDELGDFNINELKKLSTHDLLLKSENMINSVEGKFPDFVSGKVRKSNYRNKFQ